MIWIEQFGGKFPNNREDKTLGDAWLVFVWKKTKADTTVLRLVAYSHVRDANIELLVASSQNQVRAKNNARCTMLIFITISLLLTYFLRFSHSISSTKNDKCVEWHPYTVSYCKNGKLSTGLRKQVRKDENYVWRRITISFDVYSW